MSLKSELARKDWSKPIAARASSMTLETVVSLFTCSLVRAPTEGLVTKISQDCSSAARATLSARPPAEAEVFAKAGENVVLTSHSRAAAASAAERMGRRATEDMAAGGETKRATREPFER